MKTAIMAAALALCASSANAADFWYNDDAKTELVLTGMIVPEDVTRLQVWLKNEKVKFLFLDSEGGYQKPALEMAGLIYDRKMTVYVAKGDTCASACLTLFSAGDKRFFQYGSSLAVHSLSMEGTGDDKGKNVESTELMAQTLYVARIYIGRHVPDPIVIKMIATPGSSDYQMEALTTFDLTIGGWAEGYE